MQLSYFHLQIKQSDLHVGKFLVYIDSQYLYYSCKSINMAFFSEIYMECFFDGSLHLGRHPAGCLYRKLWIEFRLQGER